MAIKILNLGGDICYVCEKEIIEKGVEFENNYYHLGCFGDKMRDPEFREYVLNKSLEDFVRGGACEKEFSKCFG